MAAALRQFRQKKTEEEPFAMLVDRPQNGRERAIKGFRESELTGRRRGHRARVHLGPPAPDEDDVVPACAVGPAAADGRSAVAVVSALGGGRLDERGVPRRQGTVRRRSRNRRRCRAV